MEKESKAGAIITISTISNVFPIEYLRKYGKHFMMCTLGKKLGRFVCCLLLY